MTTKRWVGRLPAGAKWLRSRVVGKQSIHHYRLSNGLQVIVWEDHQAPVAAYQTWFRVGSGHERRGRTGMAHLFEHLMFKETRNHPAGEFDRILETHGIETNAATWLDWTYYKENLPSQHLPLVMELEADRMENMILSQSQLDTEREVVRNERLLRVDNDPEGGASEELYYLHFGRHPYGHPTIGWMKDILAITLDDCLEFHAKYYAPDNAIVSVCGDVDPQEVMELAQRFYGHIPAGPGALGPRVRPRSPVGTYKKLELPVTVSKTMLMYDGPRALENETTVLRVVAELLWGAESAYWRERLLHDLQAVNDIQAYHVPFRIAGTIEVQLNMVPDSDVEKTLAALRGATEEFLARGVSAEQLEGAKNRVEMAYLRSLMQVGSRARGIGHVHATYGDWTELFRFAEATGKVTAAECLESVRRHFLESTPTRVDLVPGEGSDEGEDEE